MEPLDPMGVPPASCGEILCELPIGEAVLHGEQVIKAGLPGTRGWRYVRWTDGSHLAWLGRRVRPGRVQSAGSLQFDIAHVPHHGGD